MPLSFQKIFILPPSHLPWWLAPLAHLLSLLLLIGVSFLPLGAGLNQNLQFIAFMLLLSGLPWFFHRPVTRAEVALLSHAPTSWRRIAVVTVLGFLLLQLVAFIFESSSQAAAESSAAFIRSLELGKNNLNDILLILSMTVFAPLGEEALYRGLIFRSLYDGIPKIKLASLQRWLRPEFALGFALVVSAAIFAQAHGGEGQDAQTIALLLHGIIYALIFVISGSLLAAIMAHALNNAFALWQVFQAVPDVSLTPIATALIYLGPVLALALALGWQQLFPRQVQEVS